MSGPGPQRDLALACCPGPRSMGGCSQLLEEPKEAPCLLQPPQYLHGPQGGGLAGRVRNGMGVSWDPVLRLFQDCSSSNHTGPVFNWGSALKTGGAGHLLG